MIAFLAVTLLASSVIAFVALLTAHRNYQPLRQDIIPESAYIRAVQTGYKALNMPPSLEQAIQYEKFLQQVHKLGVVESGVKRIK